MRVGECHGRQYANDFVLLCRICCCKIQEFPYSTSGGLAQLNSMYLCTLYLQHLPFYSLCNTYIITQQYNKNKKAIQVSAPRHATLHLLHPVTYNFISQISRNNTVQRKG